MSDLSAKAVFQTLRKLQLSKDDLAKNVKQFETDGVIVVINGNLKILEVNFDAVKDKTNLDTRIAKAVNTAIEAMQKEHFQTLQGITI